MINLILVIIANGNIVLLEVNSAVALSPNSEQLLILCLKFRKVSPKLIFVI